LVKEGEKEYWNQTIIEVHKLVSDITIKPTTRPLEERQK